MRRCPIRVEINRERLVARRITAWGERSAKPLRSPARSARLDWFRVVTLACDCGRQQAPSPAPRALAARAAANSAVGLGKWPGVLQGRVGLSRAQHPLHPTWALSVRFVSGLGQAARYDQQARLANPPRRVSSLLGGLYLATA
jgi:hypothetical protein